MPNDYPTKYSSETLKSILEYLKNGKYPEGIEEIKRKKNEIIAKNESTKKLKRNATTKLDDAKRHFRNKKKDIKHKLCEYELNGKKYISLKRNWTHAIKKNEDNEDIKRRSRSLDNQDRDFINEWLIIPFEWQISIIIYEWHVKTGSHLKIQATLDHILAGGYKWDSIYGDVRNFWFKCQIWQVSSEKLRKGKSFITYEVVSL